MKKFFAYRVVAWIVWIIPAWALGFTIGLINHFWFFPNSFHGDAAGKSVFASAILAEGNLLPYDFAYSTGFFLFDQSYLIALLQLLGVQGYDAFALGSALSVGFWGIILFLGLSLHFQARGTALLFSGLLLIPLGFWEADFIIGQQSHTSLAILSLLYVIVVGRYAEKSSVVWLTLLAVCVFLLSISAPARGMLLIVSVLVAAPLFLTIKQVVRASGFSLGGLLAAYMLHQILLDGRTLGRDFLVSELSESTAFLGSFGQSLNDVLNGVSSLYVVSGPDPSLSNFLIYILALGLIATYLITFIFYSSSAVRSLKAYFSEDRVLVAIGTAGSARFFALTSVSGIWIGAIAVAAVNPDSARHFLWAIFLLKLVILMNLHNVLYVIFPLWRRRNAVLLSLFVIVLSNWTAQLSDGGMSVLDAFESRQVSETSVAIQDAVKATGVTHIYGDDFWRMTPLNTYVPGIQAQSLLDPGAIRTYNWLTVPSWACTESNVLYLTKDTVMDQRVVVLLGDSGGQLIHEGSDFKIWLGAPVWSVPDSISCP